MAGQELPVGARVYYYDQDGSTLFGEVKDFEVTDKGTKVARIVLEKTKAEVAWPLAFVTVQSPPLE